jgi:hypothetical protein
MRLLFAALMIMTISNYSVLKSEELSVDFEYSPPKWQATICLPDDPQKTLVDREGELLYHFGKGRNPFGTRVGIEIDPEAEWEGQRLHSPRVPKVRTERSAGDLRIIEEAFAITGLAASPETSSAQSNLMRLDSGGINSNWANPANAAEPSLKDIAVHFGGSIEFAAVVEPGDTRLVALALCEGWWDEAGQRIQLLQVEGADPVEVDTVADIGRNRASVFWFDARDEDADGRILIKVAAATAAGDKNTILNGIWIFPADTPRESQSLLDGRMNPDASARMTHSLYGGPPRNDIVLVHLHNEGSRERTIQPRLVIDTVFECDWLQAEQQAKVNRQETITASLEMTGFKKLDATRYAVELAPITLDAGASTGFYMLYSTGHPIVLEPVDWMEAMECRQAAIEYWQSAPLPFGSITVPDKGIQALIDAAIRNIWQAREIKNGLPAFQVGPTVYRGLWIVDGAFLLECAAMLGAGEEARAGVEYVLQQQQPSGAFEVLSPLYYKENGIVLWTCLRHARLTQDPEWLRSVWPRVRATVGYIQKLRRQSLENDTPLDDGLIPPGFIDGGLGGSDLPEYTNTYWNLLGLKAAISAAHWLGMSSDAEAWQAEYDDFLATFRRAAERDMLTDPHGNRYLPTRMANLGDELPQRGQWAFCHAIYPGQVFEREDPLVLGNLEMLQATEVEGGMVYGTGWDATGIWNYFASFYGHAWLWQGTGTKAAECLYAFANHAAPILAWREEQSLKGEPYRQVGDMPHNWASAEFVRLAIHLLALDRGNELHLLEGLPRSWAGPGMETRLDGIATPFGPLTAALRVSSDGRRAVLEIEPLADSACQAVVVHLGSWTGHAGERVERLDPGKAHRLEIELHR